MMKRIVYILILILASIGMTRAQDGLNIARLFDGRYKKQPNATEVLVKERKLEPYNLSLFRSLTIKDSPADFAEMERLVQKDTESAIEKEVVKIGGKIYYGFYQLPMVNKKYRYLFFRNNSLRNPDDKEMIVVYMEGNTTLKQLKNMFK